MSLPDGKLYFNLTEICGHLKITPSTLRYWESEFPSLNPKRNEKGVRFYTKQDVVHIEQIHLLVKQQKFTIQGAIQKIRQDKNSIDQQLKILKKLNKIKDFLSQLKQEL